MTTGKWIAVGVSALIALFLIIYLIPALIFSSGKTSGGATTPEKAPEQSSRTVPEPEVSP